MLCLSAPAPTEIYTLSLHDALPILGFCNGRTCGHLINKMMGDTDSGPDFIHLRSQPPIRTISLDRKSTRLNSSHVAISYAVFCLKEKNANQLPVHAALVQRDAQRDP